MLPLSHSVTVVLLLPFHVTLELVGSNFARPDLTAVVLLLLFLFQVT